MPSQEAIPPSAPKRARPKRVNTVGEWLAADGEAKLPVVFAGLREMYGERRWRAHAEPIDELVLTILSQRNTDRSTEQAYLTLRERFPTWEQVMLAPVEEIADAIHYAGLYLMKAPRIQAVLRQVIEERGNFDLRFLSELPLEEARAWLLALPGVGPKTTAIVLLFSLGRPAFPVDTHVYRVTQRVGLIGPKATEASAHITLEAMIREASESGALPATPQAAMFEMHINLIGHGRKLCHAISPECTRCKLLPICPFGQHRIAPHDETHEAQFTAPTNTKRAQKSPTAKTTTTKLQEAVSE